MANLKQTLGVQFLKVCKTCGAVNNHPYRCTPCEEKAAKEQHELELRFNERKLRENSRRRK